MKIDRKINEPKWYKLNKSVEFQVRPFPFSQRISTEIMPMMLEQFNYCLVDWKGIYEEDGKTKLPVNDENKLYLYDFSQQIKDFVIGKSHVASGLDKQLKN